ncbi:MAG: metallophosphoesterase family protein [Panacagrimonas sp.]
MAFSFIHAADLHLDSPLRGLSSYGEELASVAQGATRRAFSQLINEAIDRQVNFIVIAGDVADGGWNDVQTGTFFIRECARAAQHGIPTYLLWGNHDAESHVTRKLTLPDGVHKFPHNKPATHSIDALKVKLHGQSYERRDVFDNLAKDYPHADAGWFNIGVLHTCLTGGGANTPHAEYAPCSLADLKARGYQYWALGHLHGHEIVAEDPWVVFPGNLQGRNKRETGAKGAVLVRVDDEHRVEVEHLAVDVLRWHEAVVNASQAESMSDVADAVEVAIRSAWGSIKGRPLVCRVVIQGPCAANAILRRDPVTFRAELEVRCLKISHAGLFIEKIKVHTRPHERSVQRSVSDESVKLLRQILEESENDAELHAELARELEPALRKLIADGEVESELLVLARDGRWQDLIRNLGPELLDQLLTGAEA